MEITSPGALLNTYTGTKRLILADFPLSFIFNPENGGNTVLRNVSGHLPDFSVIVVHHYSYL
jgi:hypothetical protein